MTHDTMAPPVPEPAPVAVTGRLSVDGAVQVHEEAADYGAYQTFILAAADIPQRILPRDEGRARAYLTVSGTGPVWVGTEQQCEQIKAGAAQTAGMISGGLIASGITLPVTHKQEVWIVPDGTHTATVTIAVERWKI